MAQGLGKPKNQTGYKDVGLERKILVVLKNRGQMFAFTKYDELQLV
jgi:hypothetical protein